MSHLLQEQNSSVKSNIKPKQTVKSPLTKIEIEFRWSISAAHIALQEEASLLALHPIDLNSPKKRSVLPSQPSTARSSTTNQSSSSTQNLSLSSPRLSNVNNINNTKELSTSTDQNNNGRKTPLIVTYSQLHRAQQHSQPMKTSRTSFSISPSLNNKQRNISNRYSRLPFSSKSTSLSKIQQRLAINKYKK
ncbi:unnamed protein product [Rotaria sordida]|uniref:Uncharacterized protein n=1 Tax=Rotaria sordida TaxID=392033 RepID=A0A818Q755_9BILA|nr:unnamed protein product [Rotaria sordida]